MSNRLSLLGATLLTAGMGSGTALAQTAERGCIELKTVAEIQETYVDERGQNATRLVPAAKVVPGDEVTWTIVANNVCTTPASDVAITNPLPAHMRYVQSSAFGPGASIEFSLVGASFAAPETLLVAAADGSRRQARPDEDSAIRWVLPNSIGPSESWIVRYRATVL